MAKAFEAKIPVQQLEDVNVAKVLVNKGEYKAAAAKLVDFCNANYTLRGEHGEIWSEFKLAALLLVNATADKVARIMRPITNLYPRFK